MKTDTIVWLPLDRLQKNTGQVPGLPANPRQWTDGDVRRIARSLKETPELFPANPLKVLPFGAPEGDAYVILGGNLRSEGARRNGMKEVPCYVFPADTQAKKLKEIVIKDNGSFGAWDYDALGNAWDDLPLTEWGVPAWKMADGLSTKGREGAEGYDEFVDKFNEELPLTTDDCYTPPEVYDAVKDFVDKKVLPLKGQRIIRPFYPGGDYEKADYSDGVVIDNPPFSIYAKIVRFYTERKIPFFIFGPQLTLFVSNADVTFLPLNVVITYENGAKVNTGFVTNLMANVRIYIDPDLRRRVAEIQKTEPTTVINDFPAEVVTSATLGKIANGGELVLRKGECSFIHDLDAMKERGAGLFGGGFLLSRAAAEKARAVKIDLSPREAAIVEQLSKNDL